MSLLVKTCVRTAAVLGIMAAGFACKKNDEYGSATASPGSGAYTSPESGAYGSPGTTGGMASPGMGTASMRSGSMTVQVRSVDRDANTITVTDTATASPRTLPVDTGARTQLADVKPGDQVMITCGSGTASPGMGSTGAGTGSMGTGSTGGGSMGSGSLSSCTTVASIMPESASSRGR